MLSSFAAFQQHIDAQMEGLSGHQIGDPWQEFSKGLIALTDLGKEFPVLRNNPRKTRDKGWDILGTRGEDEKEKLYIQAKFKVNDRNVLEGVISDWVALAGIPDGQLTLEGIVPGA